VSLLISLLLLLLLLLTAQTDDNKNVIHLLIDDSHILGAQDNRYFVNPHH